MRFLIFEAWLFADSCTEEAPKPEKATRARVSARKSVRYSLVYNKPAGADDDAIEDISEAEEEEDKGDVTRPGGDEEPYDEEEVEQELQQHRTKSPVRPGTSCQIVNWKDTDYRY